MAPEMCEWNSYEKPVDIYSFGMMLYEMVIGQNPWTQFHGW